MAARPEVIDLLGKTVLFAGLSPEDLTPIALDLRERTFKSGQLIFGRGDPGRNIYLVLEGRVRLSVVTADGRALAFSHAGRGDIFGEIAALDGGRRTADAIALAKVSAMMLSQSALKRHMETTPKVAMAAITFLCKRLRTTSEQLEEVALNPIEVRIARFILHALKLAQQLETATPVRLDIGMSQGELALLIGTSRQSVNSGLATLERNGLIRRSGTVLECNIERLSALAAIE